MDNREKAIREEVEAELALIKADPWRSQPTIKFKLEDVCMLLSIIDNLWAELRAAQDCKLNLEAIGGCDHEVGLCVCGVISLIADAEEALADLEG